MALELRLIRHALALGRTRNFARAAEALHLTQPSLSRSIAALEGQLGVALFDRLPKGVEPTVFGRLLLERGQALLHDESELRREMQLLAGAEIGTLAVGVGPYAGTDIVATAIARLVASHPRLQVQALSEGADTVVAGVLRGRFDVGVVARAGFDDDARLAIDPLPPQPVFVACRPDHPLAGARGLDLARVLAFPLVTAPVLGETLVSLLKAHALGNVDPETGAFMPAIAVNSFEMARGVALHCDALLPGTEAMLADDLASGRMVRLDFRIPAMQVTPSLVTRRARTRSPAAQAFAAAMHELHAPAIARPRRAARGS